MFDKKYLYQTISPITNVCCSGIERALSEDVSSSVENVNRVISIPLRLYINTDLRRRFYLEGKHEDVLRKICEFVEKCISWKRNAFNGANEHTKVGGGMVRELHDYIENALIDFFDANPTASEAELSEVMTTIPLKEYDELRKFERAYMESPLYCTFDKRLNSSEQYEAFKRLILDTLNNAYFVGQKHDKFYTNLCRTVGFIIVEERFD